MCRLRELLPYFDGYKSLRRSPCNNLQRLRRLTFHYFFTIFSWVFLFYCLLRQPSVFLSAFPAVPGTSSRR